MKTKKFFAVRVVLRDSFGSTYTRDYVRGEMHVGRQAFIAFAVGDFIGTITEGFLWEATFVRVFEIGAHTVIENRKYLHTTHTGR